jgi:ABC-type cobalamin/Fe3+-siderophores transport system ATPase subunit
MSKVLVMTGGPGVGKTTIVKAILRILAAKSTNLLLCDAASSCSRSHITRPSTRFGRGD